MKRLTTEHFINKSIKIHSDVYDYSKVVYKNNHSVVEIICKQHGSFFQRPYDHYNKKGCAKCSGNMPKDTGQFIEDSKLVHGEEFDYSRVNYTGNKNKVEIICRQHGIFLQKPNNHLSGAGCLKCAGLEKKDNTYFIEKANKVHNNFFDYSKAIYINSHAKLEIVCPKHGSFWQTPSHHIASGAGCSRCSSLSSKVENQWLDIIGLPCDNKHRQVFLRIKDKKYRVDGYDPNSNTIYEFLGDFWHGNLLRFGEKEINPILKKTYLELNIEWVKRKTLFEDSGFNVVFIWENDFRNNDSYKRKGFST